MAQAIAQAMGYAMAYVMAYGIGGSDGHSTPLLPKGSSDLQVVLWLM